MPVKKGTRISPNDSRLDLYVPTPVKAWLQDYAASQRRTLTSIVNQLLEREMNQVDGAFGVEKGDRDGE